MVVEPGVRIKPAFLALTVTVEGAVVCHGSFAHHNEACRNAALVNGFVVEANSASLISAMGVENTGNKTYELHLKE